MSDDICAICHEVLGNNLYNLPECSHNYHTNCIMTWFRAGHNTCPLCNNKGINATNKEANDHINNVSWEQRQSYLSLYKEISRNSKRKNAPVKMKKAVEKVVKYQKKFSEFKKESIAWKKSMPENTTVREIILKISKYRQRKWKMARVLRDKKRMIGYLYGSKIVNIILPQKIDV
tara:strand:+ start:96 stop:620 length:525 start_codon:yes stop_codon:yes gene_type:complete